MIGGVGKGYKYAIESLNVGRIGIGAQVSQRTETYVCVCISSTADAGCSQRVSGKRSSLYP